MGSRGEDSRNFTLRKETERRRFSSNKIESSSPRAKASSFGNPSTKPQGPNKLQKPREQNPNACTPRRRSRLAFEPLAFGAYLALGVWLLELSGSKLPAAVAFPHEILPPFQEALRRSPPDDSRRGQFAGARVSRGRRRAVFRRARGRARASGTWTAMSIIDYVGTWGPAILGHAPAVVLEAIADAAEQGRELRHPESVRSGDGADDLRLGAVDRKSAHGQ